jgi:uncharacterized protein (DUF58 family)
MVTQVVLERPPADPSGSARLLAKQLKRRRVYIFPTLQGWLYVVMLIVMLLGAINYNNSMAYMLCFLLASLGLVCMLHTYRNLAGLILTPIKPKAVFVGQQALFPIQLDNRLSLTRFSIKLESHDKVKIFRKRKQHHIVSIGLEASKQSTSYYPIQTSKRGTLSLEHLKISTTFPLGIFTAWAYYEPEFYCLVYPAPKGQKQLPLTSLHEENCDFGIQSGADDFAGFRKYRPGDPVNSIAWKAYAREQGLLVKQFSGTGSQTLMLNWNAVSHISNTESRLSQFCYWVLLADKSSIHYGLEIPDAKIEPGHGMHHKERCLEALARYGKP